MTSHPVPNDDHHKRQQKAQKAMDAIAGKGLPGRGEEPGGKVVRLNIPETLLPALEYVAQVAKARRN